MFVFEFSRCHLTNSFVRILISLSPRHLQPSLHICLLLPSSAASPANPLLSILASSLFSLLLLFRAGHCGVEQHPSHLSTASHQITASPSPLHSWPLPPPGFHSTIFQRSTMLSVTAAYTAATADELSLPAGTHVVVLTRSDSICLVQPANEPPAAAGWFPTRLLAPLEDDVVAAGDPIELAPDDFARIAGQEKGMGRCCDWKRTAATGDRMLLRMSLRPLVRASPSLVLVPDAFLPFFFFLVHDSWAGAARAVCISTRRPR